MTQSEVMQSGVEAETVCLKSSLKHSVKCSLGLQQMFPSLLLSTLRQCFRAPMWLLSTPVQCFRAPKRFWSRHERPSAPVRCFRTPKWLPSAPAQRSRVPKCLPSTPAHRFIEFLHVFLSQVATSQAPRPPGSATSASQAPRAL